MTNQNISQREKEVLHLLAYENSSKEIAKELFISEHTVFSHRKNLLSKMQVKNTAGLVRKGFELGLLSLSRNVAFVLLLILGSICSTIAQNEVELRSDGIVVPRTTTSAVSSPIEGMLIYDTSTDGFKYYNGSTWQSIGSGTGGALF